MDRTNLDAFFKTNKNDQDNFPQEMKIEFGKKFSVTGITSVIESSSEILTLQMGQKAQLYIEGANLVLANLDLTNKALEANGEIIKIKYLNKDQTLSIKKRIFK